MEGQEIWVFTRTYMMYMYMHICLYVYMSICLYVYMYVYMSMYTYRLCACITKYKTMT